MSLPQCKRKGPIWENSIGINPPPFITYSQYLISRAKQIDAELLLKLSNFQKETVNESKLNCFNSNHAKQNVIRAPEPVPVKSVALISTLPVVAKKGKSKAVPRIIYNDNPIDSIPMPRPRAPDRVSIIPPNYNAFIPTVKSKIKRRHVLLVPVVVSELKSDELLHRKVFPQVSSIPKTIVEFKPPPKHQLQEHIVEKRAPVVREMPRENFPMQKQESIVKVEWTTDKFTRKRIVMIEDDLISFTRAPIVPGFVSRRTIKTSWTRGSPWSSELF